MFIAYLKQEGEGCDYTIGCGLEVVELQAATYEEAAAELREEYLYDGEDRLEAITLYEVSRKEEMPVVIWYAEKERLGHLESEHQEEENERRLYERLRQKFDKEA